MQFHYSDYQYLCIITLLFSKANNTNIYMLLLRNDFEACLTENGMLARVFAVSTPQCGISLSQGMHQ